MFNLDQKVREFYAGHLERAGVLEADRASFIKWALYYLDYCKKYHHPPRAVE